ncbi:hypothetical protein T492DRAFT_912391, partial [Pavlovales sp. CCMP2436]
MKLLPHTHTHTQRLTAPVLARGVNAPGHTFAVDPESCVRHSDHVALAPERL